MDIKTVFDFNKALDIGAYAWPGGYPCYFICEDGQALSWKAVEENQGLIRDAIISGADPQWRVVGMEINLEDTTLTCAHTGARIESAYGED